MRFKNREHTPPDWFRFKHPETGYVSRRMSTRHNWIEDIKIHRQSNNLPPVSAAEAEDQCCRTIDLNGASTNQAIIVPMFRHRFGWNELVSGMQAFGNLMLGGFKFVSQEEANRRAKICASCFLNTNPEGCGACQRMASLITGDVAKKKAPYDESLMACAVCKCANKSKVWFRLEDIPVINEQQNAFPSFCWQKIGGRSVSGGSLSGLIQ